MSVIAFPEQQAPTAEGVDRELVLMVLQPSSGRELPVKISHSDWVRIVTRGGKLRVNSYGYVQFTTKGSGVETLLHRFLVAPEGELIPEGIFVDHINRDRLDNRQSNLRLVSPSQNLKNSRFTILPARSGQVGVYPARHGKWHVKVSGVSYGLYSGLEEAKAVARAAIAQREAAVQVMIDAISSRRLVQLHTVQGEKLPIAA